MSRPAYRDGDVIFSCEDEEGIIDVVDEANALRSLQFGTQARQSTMFLNDPAALALSYTHCLMVCLLFAERPPRSALMLGLGGGSLVKFLLKQFPDCQLDTVERRAAVLDVARRFFELGDDPRNTVHCEDGRDFLARHTGPSSEARCYDLIFADLHDSTGMAPVVRAPEFFPQCRQLLDDSGILATNLWYGYKKEEEEAVRQNLEAAFDPGPLYLPVAGKLNCIALAFATAPTTTANAVAQRAAQWQRRLGIDFPSLLVELTRFNNGLHLPG